MGARKWEISKKIVSISFFVLGVFVSPIIFSVNLGFASSWWALLLCWLLSFAFSKEELSEKIKKKHWLPVLIAFVVFIIKSRAFPRGLPRKNLFVVQ